MFIPTAAIVPIIIANNNKRMINEQENEIDELKEKQEKIRRILNNEDGYHHHYTKEEKEEKTVLPSIFKVINLYYVLAIPTLLIFFFISIFMKSWDYFFSALVPFLFFATILFLGGILNRHHNSQLETIYKKKRRQ